MQKITSYILEDQVGHLLRRANQRHTALFARRFANYDLTPLQFAVLMKLADHDRGLSQNHLGRLTSMDPNTTQGVVQRLLERELISRLRSTEDRRRFVLSLTAQGKQLTAELIGHGVAISAETLEPLSAQEQQLFIGLLKRLI
jgi:DNA-binding MarR family transcriptional regulator